MNKLVQDVLSLLNNVAEISNGWTAQCPAHDDNCNSLTIREARDGKVLMYCHAGCTIYEVVDALGITMSALFPATRKGAK